jgi:iron complex transport system substrate-binding protein
MRVVSLLPSATEILYALGVEPVAVSHECDYPPAAQGRPAANESRIDPDAASENVNEQVSSAESEGGIYRLREGVLREADPDLILTQGVCDVCAVDDQLVRSAVDDLGLDADVLTTHPHELDDVFEDVLRIGGRTGNKKRATELVANLRDQVRTVRQRVTADGRRVAVLDWMDPVMIAGHWIPGMVETAGGRYGMADPGERSRPRPFEELLAYDPEVLVAAPCGFSLERTIEHIGELTERDGFDELTATKEGAVYAMDGHHHVNRPGPRLVDTLKHLAGILQPETFDPPPRSVVRRVDGGRHDVSDEQSVDGSHTDGGDDREASDL